MTFALPARRTCTRARRRYNIDLPVRFTHQSNQRQIVMHTGWTRNISRKGLCVCSEYVVDVGTEVTLELGMDGTELVLFGRIVWTAEQPDHSLEMGIELTSSEIDPALFDWVLETGTGFERQILDVTARAGTRSRRGYWAVWPALRSPTRNR